MTYTQKFVGIVLAAFIAATIYGGYFYPKASPQAIGVGSASGSTFNTAKFAGTVIDASASGSTGTSSSVLNTDSSDRFISGFRVGCNGVGSSKTAYSGTGLASWTLTIGTSTSASPATFAGFANVANSYVLSTTTPVLVVASSTTQTATSSLAARWPSGSYVDFVLNATNTAICTVGVDYLPN